MIKKKVFSGKTTDEQGDLELKFDFYGHLCEINLDLGELDMDSMVEFETSSGRKIPIERPKSVDFPISPRRLPNEDRYVHATVENPQLEKFVNAGTFKITFAQAGAQRMLRTLEIVYEE